MAHKIRSALQTIAQTQQAGANRSLRASVCTALGAALILFAARRRGALGGMLAAFGGASLYRALSDWLGPVPRPSAGVIATENDIPVGWAPESGEHGEPRAGYSPGTVYSTWGDDVGVAPESGDRVMEEPTGAVSERGEPSQMEDRVLEGSEESFPASDAPSWTPGRT